ncbi:DM13 domain-containing protein [Candidatus Woesearchaeota archaeon]|nr:DM13 domain-containing protein [Candidatus Woesearchaeota archaeon]
MDADNFHKTKGMSKVFDIGDKRYLRFEDFETTNGPKLVVYLSTDLQASDYISLGNLKGNIGDQNYEIPNNVDLNKYDKVLIWCEPFRVLFGSSKLI